MDKFDIKKYNGVLHILSILFLLIVTCKVMVFLLPFVIAALIVYIINPIIIYINKKIKIESSFIKILILLIFYLTIGSILFLVLFNIIVEGYKFSEYIFKNQKIIVLKAKEINENINNSIEFMPAYIVDYINKIVERLISSASSYIFKIFSFGIDTIKKIPNMLIFVIITIFSSFIMVNDENTIYTFLEKQLPKKWIEKFLEIKDGVLNMLLVYLKAQMILISISFIEILIGLSIISIYINKIEYILFYAFIICIVDALPILGSGVILTPFAIFNIIVSNYYFAIALLILQFIIWGSRQLLEPKLISKGAKNHILLTLVSMYATYNIFGIIGFIIGPIILSIIKIVFHEEIEYGFFKYLIGDKKE